MQIFSYLSKIVSSGSLLSWDGNKIVPSKSISPVIWKWNEKDTSQFNINLDTANSGILSVKNNSWGPSLCIDFKDISSNNGIFIFSISDFNLNPDELNRYRYILKFRLCDFSGFVNNWFGLGITFLSNNKKNENYFGLGNVCSFSNQNVKACKFENGNIKISDNSPIGPRIALNSNFGRPVTNLEHEINYIKNSDSIGFQNSWNVRNAITTINDALGLDETYYSSEFGNFNSSWFSQELSSCGFIFLGANNKNSVNLNIDNKEIINSSHFSIDNIEIIKHPMNW